MRRHSLPPRLLPKDSTIFDAPNVESVKPSSEEEIKRLLKENRYCNVRQRKLKSLIRDGTFKNKAILPDTPIKVTNTSHHTENSSDDNSEHRDKRDVASLSNCQSSEAVDNHSQITDKISDVSSTEQCDVVCAEKTDGNGNSVDFRDRAVTVSTVTAVPQSILKPIRRNKSFPSRSRLKLRVRVRDTPIIHRRESDDDEYLDKMNGFVQHDVTYSEVTYSYDVSDNSTQIYRVPIVNKSLPLLPPTSQLWALAAQSLNLDDLSTVERKTNTWMGTRSPPLVNKTGKMEYSSSSEECISSSDEDESANVDDGLKASDADDEVKCEVVHSYTPRPNLHRLPPVKPTKMFHDERLDFEEPDKVELRTDDSKPKRDIRRKNGVCLPPIGLNTAKTVSVTKNRRNSLPGSRDSRLKRDRSHRTEMLLRS